MISDIIAQQITELTFINILILLCQANYFSVFLNAFAFIVQPGAITRMPIRNEWILDLLYWLIIVCWHKK